MPRPSLVIAIVEDEHHRRLIYRYLRERRLSTHEIRLKASPSGGGSGEKWVRAMYATELTAYRTRQTKASSALVVMIDADTHSVQERLNQLSGELTKVGVDRTRNTEHIAHLIPKRNVETWILCLTETAVDEETDYRRTHHDWTELIPQAAKTLNRWCAAGFVLPSTCVDSLRLGVNELHRLRL